MESATKRYYAFISYKRQDKRQAMWLQRQLEIGNENDVFDSLEQKARYLYE